MYNIQNNITKYDKQQYIDGPVKFHNYVNDIYDKVHQQLYKNALNKYILKKKEEDSNYNENEYTYIELKGMLFYSPSEVVVIGKKLLTDEQGNKYFYKETVNLNEYWDSNYELLNRNKNIELILNANKDLYEIDNINYVNDYCTLTNKFDDSEIDIDFDYINSSINKKEKYKDTFKSLLKKL